jgi:calcineurin-like phosphoesterase family protein
MNKKIYVTSDWHVGHAKSIEYDNRPFNDLKHMHRVLVNNYNASVNKNDICYFLGDIGMYDATEMKKIIKSLNGTKILIKGNHDKKGMQYWTSAGFDAVLNIAAITVNKDLVTMSHCPLRGIKREDVKGMKGAVNGENWHGERKHYAYSLPDWGQFHLHGHIHSGPHKSYPYTIDGRQYDIGVVANNYRPVSYSQIESWIAKYKRDNYDNGN